MAPAAEGEFTAQVTQRDGALRPSRRSFLSASAVLAGLAAAPGTAAAAQTTTQSDAQSDAQTGGQGRVPVVGRGWPSPFVVGHRGASAYRPEHTVAAWELAARMGADVIEPDLVPTRDGVLVCRHEPEISGTTDVARHPEFADRRKTLTIDGTETTGWFTQDFTLAELRTLRAVERLPLLRQRNTVYDGAYQVPTFDEALATRRRLSAELGRTIGIIPEIKHPTFFRSIDRPMEREVVARLKAFGLNTSRAPVTVQSFELTNLRELRTRLGLRTSTVFLTAATGAPADLVAAGDPRRYADLLTPAGLRDLARFVGGIGPALDQVIPRSPDGTLGAPTRLVEDAHAAGLRVVPYTLRPENSFLPLDFQTSTAGVVDPAAYGRVLDYAVELFETGIDGIFTDAPDIGVVARERFLAGS